MGTANFPVPENAGRYYVFSPEGGIDEFEYGWFRENLSDRLGELGYDSTGNVDTGRDRYRAGVLQLWGTRTYGDVCFQVCFHCFIGHGYYEGLMMDFRIVVECEGEEVEYGSFKEALPGLLEDWSEMPKGWQAVQRKNITKWVDGKVAEMKAAIEGVYGQCSSHVFRSRAVFGNGEAIYYG